MSTRRSASGFGTLRQSSPWSMICQSVAAGRSGATGSAAAGVGGATGSGSRRRSRGCRFRGRGLGLRCGFRRHWRRRRRWRRADAAVPHLLMACADAVRSRDGFELNKYHPPTSSRTSTASTAAIAGARDGSPMAAGALSVRGDTGTADDERSGKSSSDGGAAARGGGGAAAFGAGGLRRRGLRWRVAAVAQAVAAAPMKRPVAAPMTRSVAAPMTLSVPVQTRRSAQATRRPAAFLSMGCRGPYRTARGSPGSS